MKSASLFLLSLITGINSSLQNEIDDPCSKIGNNSIVTYRRAVACLDFFPFNDTLRHATMRTIRKTMELYAYRKISANYAHGQISSFVNLDSAFDALETETYKTDREFHDKVYNLFLSLNDAHTRYRSTCFHTWRFYQPFIMSAQLSSGGEQSIYIQESLPEEQSQMYNTFSSVMGFNVSDANGWKVLQIDGQNALKTIIEYAETEVGTARDIGVRFNLALGRFDYRNGEWRTIFGSFASREIVPQSEFTKYRVETKGGKVMELDVPFLVNVTTEVTSATDYWRKLCIPSPTKESHNSTLNKTLVEPIVETNTVYNSEHQFEEVEMVPDIHYKRRGSIQDSEEVMKMRAVPQPFLNGSNDAFFDLDHGTVVMKVASFSDTEFPPMISIIQRWNEAFQWMKNRKSKNLILDVSNNGGGYVCLGYGLINLLVPNMSDHSTDFITSPFLDALTSRAYEQNQTNSFFYPIGSWIDPSTNKFYRDMSWVTDGPIYHRGGYLHEYTKKITLNCKTIKDRFTKFKKPLFKPENIIVVSNGYCGSTCALVARRLHDAGVKQVGVGGISGRPLAFSEFAGGQVFRYTTILTELNQLKLDALSAPEPFKSNAELSFTIREAYSKNKPDTPLEFDYMPASYRIVEKNFYSVDKLWSDVKAMFPS